MLPVNKAAVVKMLNDIFGDHFEFSLHTYDYPGLPARKYNSFEAIVTKCLIAGFLAVFSTRPPLIKGA